MTEPNNTETPPPETPVPEQPPASQPAAEPPALVAVEVEPQKVPSFANWTQEEKEKYAERLERLEKLTAPKEETRPPEQRIEPDPKPAARKRGLRYKSRK